MGLLVCFWQFITVFQTYRKNWKNFTLHIYTSLSRVLYSVTQSCLTLCNPMGCSPPGSLSYTHLLLIFYYTYLIMYMFIYWFHRSIHQHLLFSDALQSKLETSEEVSINISAYVSFILVYISSFEVIFTYNEICKSLAYHWVSFDRPCTCVSQTPSIYGMLSST